MTGRPHISAELSAHPGARLQHPIVVQDGPLVDGNRREACRRAGGEPRVVDLNGADARTNILSANIARRHLTKGQRAMAIAKLYPERPQTGRKAGRYASTGEDPAAKNAAGGFSDRYLHQARTMLACLKRRTLCSRARCRWPTPTSRPSAPRCTRLRRAAPAAPPRARPASCRLVDESRITPVEAESAYATREELIPAPAAHGARAAE